MLPVFHAQRAQGGVKDLAVGLFTVRPLRDKDLLHEGRDPRFLDPAALHLVEPVGDDGHGGHLGQLVEDVQHIAGHQIGMGGQLVEVIAVHLGAAARSADLLQKAGKALVHQFFAADLALFQLTPQPFVDGAVLLYRLVGGLDVVLGQGLGQGLAFSGVKIKQGVVCVK